MNPTKPPEDLRAAILSLPVGKFEDGSPMYLEDIFPYIATSDFADDILRLCEAAALAAFEKKLYSQDKKEFEAWQAEHDMILTPFGAYRAGKAECRATARANIHSVFGGSNGK